MDFIKKIIPYIIGVVFILSGVTKLFSIDDFELFLYSFGFLKLNYAMVLARLVIAGELTIGLLFLFQIYLKPLSYFTLVLLFLFTVFILFLAFTKSKEDCHCFGNIVYLSNTASVIKNIVLALMIVLLSKADRLVLVKRRLIIFFGVILLGFGLTFAVRPPDFVFTKKYAAKNSYCEPCFKSFISEHQLTDKKMMVCFFSDKCKFCKLSAKKISVIAQKANNTNDILYVFFDNKVNPSEFFKKTNSIPMPYQKMEVMSFLKLTDGGMPLIVLYDKGVIQKIYGYRDLNEEELLNFLKN